MNHENLDEITKILPLCVTCTTIVDRLLCNGFEYCDIPIKDTHSLLLGSCCITRYELRLKKMCIMECGWHIEC